MAIRDDFTAGEVLAAADLNDTFGAKANLASPTFTGTPAAPTAAAGTNTTQLATTAFVQSAGGLVLVSPTSIANSGGSASASGGEVSFTGVSSVSLNGVFSSAYENYSMQVILTGSAGGDFRIRLRDAGSDAATNYKAQRLYAQSSTVATYADGTTTSARIGEIGTSKGCIIANIYQPNAADATLFNSLQTNTVTSAFLDLAGCSHSTATAYTGFTVFPNSGTITGTIRVYGYRNS
jgi:hypothetical protein